MATKFTKASKKSARLRLAIDGPSGSGKTFTALAIAKGLGGQIAVVDTEHGSASKYADQFSFDVIELTNFHPKHYVEAIKDAEANGYSVIILDSLSHAWASTGGVLEIVDQAATRAYGNKFAAWREGTPLQNELVEAILQSSIHVIATMRAKTEYVLDKDEKTGKTKPRKIGLAPVQRDGIEYEFDLTGSLDHDHTMVIDKSRCPELDRAVIKLPGEHLAKTLLAWLGQDGNKTASAKTEAPKSEAAPAATPKAISKPVQRAIRAARNGKGAPAASQPVAQAQAPAETPKPAEPVATTATPAPAPTAAPKLADVLTRKAQTITTANPASVSKAIESFGARGITLDTLQSHIGRLRAQWTPSDLQSLRDAMGRLNRGESALSVFGPEPEPAEVGGAAVTGQAMTQSAGEVANG